MLGGASFPCDRARYLRSNGQLLVSRSMKMSKNDRFALFLRKKNGVDIDIVSPDEIRQLEPELSSRLSVGPVHSVVGSSRRSKGDCPGAF